VAAFPDYPLSQAATALFADRRAGRVARLAIGAMDVRPGSGLFQLFGVGDELLSLWEFELLLLIQGGSAMDAQFLRTGVFTSTASAGPLQTHVAQGFLGHFDLLSVSEYLLAIAMRYGLGYQGSCVAICYHHYSILASPLDEATGDGLNCSSQNGVYVMVTLVRRV
jgi:hypothetical protein